MDALDAILIETAVPAAGLLLYALFLDVRESLRQFGLLPAIVVHRNLRSVHAKSSHSSVYRPTGCNAAKNSKQAA